jgi:hypothetical protein
LQPIRARTRASAHFLRHVERARLVQGVEKSFCRLEIGGVKSFGEAVMDRLRIAIVSIPDSAPVIRQP